MAYTSVGVIAGGVVGRHLAKDVQRLHPESKVTIYEPDADRRAALREDGLTVVSNPREAVQHANLIAYCTPVDVIGESLRETIPFMPTGTVLTSQLSKITPFVNAVNAIQTDHPKATHSPIFPTHYLYNPSKVESPYDQRFAIVEEREAKAGEFAEFCDFWSGVSRRIGFFENAEEHDRATANTQCNTSRTGLAIASGFTEKGCFPWVDDTYSSAADRMRFAWASRIGGAFPAHVFRNIQFGNSFGMAIAKSSLDVENRLYQHMLEGRVDEYREEVLAARDFHIGNRREPILSNEDIEQFGPLVSDQPNSHYSLIQYLVERAESGVRIFDDVKAGTPNFDVLVCLVDRLLTDDAELNRAMLAPFANKRLLGQDFVFHNQQRDWANAGIYESREFFDAKHQKMTDVLSSPENSFVIEREIKKSIEIGTLCGKKLEDFVS